MAAPTSDERREVAARLRSEADGYREFMEKWPNSNRPHIDYGEAPGYVEDIAVFIGVVHGERRIYPIEDIFDRLADLIEPPEITEDTSDGILNARTTGELVRCGECIHFERCPMRKGDGSGYCWQAKRREERNGDEG